jgi:hypothetical protein
MLSGCSSSASGTQSRPRRAPRKHLPTHSRSP